MLNLQDPHPADRCHVEPRNGASPAGSHSSGREGTNGHGVDASSEPGNRAFVDVELFAGAGGMSLGLAAVGLPPDHLFELNKHCCATLRHNSVGDMPHITGRIHEEDVAQVPWEDRIKGPVRLLSAGPPCQPFSLAGKHLAEQDERNEFPSTMRAIRALRPAAVLIENVHGLNRKSFRPYLDYILAQLECPEVPPRHGELWDEHNARIVAERTSRRFELTYRVTWGLINAADYGVPQMRSRVIILATRSGLPNASIPGPEYSKTALVREQEAGGYWDRHGLDQPTSRQYPKGPPGYARDHEGVRLPWLTVRDGLAGLPDPPDEDVHRMNHYFIPGARVYAKHNGSDPDWPSKTIKAGVHGVAGGENIMRLRGGAFRYYTLREMARLQGFPDSYYFTGPRSRVIGQIGNAVPCQLAQVLGKALRPTLMAFETNLAQGIRREPHSAREATT